MFFLTWKFRVKLVRDDFVLPENHPVTLGISFVQALLQIAVNITFLTGVHEPQVKG